MVSLAVSPVAKSLKTSISRWVKDEGFADHSGPPRHSRWLKHMRRRRRIDVEATKQDTTNSVNKALGRRFLQCISSHASIQSLAEMGRIFVRVFSTRLADR